ncbi:MAG: hypothetical protein K9M75_12770 [Phycisphaerae bacterium]|nr:hypothetical protein [Phycisphaerae bacterium]
MKLFIKMVIFVMLFVAIMQIPWDRRQELNDDTNQNPTDKLCNRSLR